MNRGRKITGGKYHKQRKKKLYEKKNFERHVVLGEPKKKFLKVRGGSLKHILLRSNTANILIGKKIQKAKIENVLETPQNRFFARQNILMKGSIIKTSLGNARITNRPSHESYINAVLVESDK